MGIFLLGLEASFPGRTDAAANMDFTLLLMSTMLKVDNHKSLRPFRQWCQLFQTLVFPLRNSKLCSYVIVKALHLEA